MGHLVRIVILLILSTVLQAQLPSPALVGYFQNWSSVSTPYVQLNQIDSRYNVIDVAFALPVNGTDYRMDFVPDQVSPTVFMNQMQAHQAAGKKILLSVGGATAPITLSSTMERDSFINSMTRILLNYNFDGIDIDLEGSSVAITGGTIASPVDASLIRMRDALQSIMGNYRAAKGRKLLLTFAPETAFVQGGQSAYGGIWGAYLPLLDALRDSTDLIHVQLYNSGTMYGIDGNVYTQGTADFIVAMTEAMIVGFQTQGGFFAGYPPEKVAIGLPACTQAAGSGYTDTATVSSAMNYLLGKGPRPGNYTLTNGSGYPNIGGMMTWSINWDAKNSCSGTYTYARNFEDIFTFPVALPAEPIATLTQPLLFPNPNKGSFVLRMPAEMVSSAFFRLYDLDGRLVLETHLQGANEYHLNAIGLRSGSYIWRVDDFSGTMLID